MKTLFIDCSMGAAGDMLTAALLELLPDPQAFLLKLNNLGIPGVTYSLEKTQKCGITGSRIHVKVNGQEEDAYLHAHHHDQQHGEQEHEHSHEHTHEGEHCHHHSSLHDIQHLLSHMNLESEVKEDILAVYSLIAEAESHAHNMPVDEIHFHEVGTMDAVADVTAVCLLLHELNPQQILASPVHVGAGTVHCAHGILPVPAPATAYILKDVPVYGGSIQSELCTPTGAALLKHFVSSFGDMPIMRVSQIGYGMGAKDFPQADCVRVMMGSTEPVHVSVSAPAHSTVRV